MPRLVMLMLLCLSLSGRAEQVPTTDPVASLLASVQSALATNNVAAFRELAAPGLPVGDRSSFELLLFSKDVSSAVVRERDREAISGQTRVLAEMLVNRHGAGQIATWQFTLTNTPGGGLKIAGLRQVSSISGLHRLELDTTTAFAVNNLSFSATEFRLTMPTGTAFVAKTAEGITAIVLRGRGQVAFEPSDPIERHQLDRFARSETLNEQIDAAYLRINPDEYQTRIAEGSLTPIATTSGDISRARAIFDLWADRSYNIALGDLSSERWTLMPAPGDALADFQSKRFKWLTYSRAAGQNEDVSLFDRDAKKNISIYASPAKIATRGRFYSEDDDRTYDVEHYELNVKFTPDRSLISGSATVRLRLLRHDADTITLKLAESLNVTSLTTPDMGRLLYLRVVGQSSIIVSFPTAQPVGKVLTLSLQYSGHLAPQSLSREAAAVNGEVAQGSQSQQQDELFPAEPNWAYSNNSNWYPQSTVTDYATARIRVAVPQNFQAISSGTLLDDSIVGTEHVSSFAADTPARYLSTVISTMVPLPTASFTSPAGKTIKIDGRSNPRQFGQTKTLTSRAADIMKFYASIVGDVPYPSLSLLSLESDLPGGHSPAYVAVINQPTPTTIFSWRNDPIAFDDQFPNYFLAHEVAHQWWGQAIGTKNYHEQWLSEGLAQYFAYLYAGRDRGPGVQRNMMERMRQSVRKFGNSGPISLGYRLGHAVGDGSNYRAVVYNKSAVVLDMLRQLIGDEAFTAGLRRFYRDWRFKKTGADDLRLAFEAESKQSLERFFERWILDAGVPNLTLHSAIETSGEAAQLRIQQVGEVFDLPAVVAIEYRDNPTEYVTVMVRGPVTELRVPLKGKVRSDGIRLMPGL